MEFANYHNGKKKWASVVVFETLPRESPKTSSEGETLARFAGLGDAYVYAQSKLQAPVYTDYALIVIR